MIRTCDLLVRSQTLYPAELRVQTEFDFRLPIEDLQVMRINSRNDRLTNSRKIGLWRRNLSNYIV